MCTVYGQCFVIFWIFENKNSSLEKMYGIMLQTQQKTSRIMLQIHRKHQE